MECRSFIYYVNPVILGRQIYCYWDLIWQLTLRQISSNTKGSYLGILWTALTPLLMLAVYAVVFGLIFGARFTASPSASASDYVLGMFLGLSLFGLVSDILGMAPTLIVQQPNFVKKVVFPLEALPLALTGSGIYRLCVSLLLLTIGAAIFGDGFTWMALLFPLVIMPIILIALGIAFLTSALGVFFRDISQITGIFSMILLYGSGIFDSANKVETMAPEIWQWLRWNPILQDIEQARRIFLWNLPVDWNAVAYAWFFGIILCCFGYAVFSRLRPAFADVV